MKVTQLDLYSLPLPNKGYKLFWFQELTGFGIRVTASGKKTYIAQGRIKGHNGNESELRVTLGPEEVLSFSEAIEMAKCNLKTMLQGLDPRLHVVYANKINPNPNAPWAK